MTPLCRFAPSPTGLLHIGNIRAALFNYLFARREAGRFMLRLDDTDRERSTDAFAKAIERDLGWLGLKWDLFARQSDRLANYDAALERLKKAGRAYACFETPDELALKRKTQLGRGLPPVYDRAALKLSDQERAALAAEGRKPHWRFLLNHADVTWDDAVQGKKSLPASALSDPVLVREDGVPLYTFSSVVDDIDFGVTNIIRGEDHVTNTAVQIQIWQALTQTPAPGFAHFPLIVSASGVEMSKRLGTLSVASLRDEMQIEPMSINSLLARLGTSDAIAPVLSLEDLARGFDLHKISHSTPKFDNADLLALNAKILHMTPYDAVRERLRTIDTGIDAAFWNAMRANLGKLGDIKQWWQVVKGPVTPVIADAAFATAASQLLPPAPWGDQSWQQWTEAVKGKTGRKGKELFMPLRLALTGVEHGPEMKVLLPLIGPDRATARLAGKAA
jgi:glutamyl-tRNA synthetase